MRTTTVVLANELSDFIIFGLSMTQAEREEYVKRGSCGEHTVVFDGVDNEKIFLRSAAGKA